MAELNAAYYLVSKAQKTTRADAVPLRHGDHLHMYDKIKDLLFDKQHHFHENIENPRFMILQIEKIQYII